MIMDGNGRWAERRHKPRTAGHVSFYWGRTIAEYAAATEKKETAAFIGEWLKYFQEHAAFMKQP